MYRLFFLQLLDYHLLFNFNFTIDILIEIVGQCKAQIPLVIMTSDDTNARTLKLLELNAYFGMKPTQVKLLKQVHKRSLLNFIEVNDLQSHNFFII